MSRLDLSKCPACYLELDAHSRDAVCLSLYGECFHCLFSAAGRGSKSGTLEQMDIIERVYKSKIRSGWK